MNLTERAKTWSNYKNHNTIKYVIGTTPAGAVSFVSAEWGRRVSDKLLTIQSGFSDKLQHGDCVLADRGFPLEEVMAARGAVLNIPFYERKETVVCRGSRQI